MYCCSQIWHGYITQSRTDWPESALPNNSPLGQGDTQNVEKVTSTRGHSLHYIFQRKIWQNPAFFHTVTCVECSGCRVHGIQDGDCVLMVAVAAPALQTTQLHFPAIALRPSARPKVLGTRFGLDTHTGTEEAGRQYCKPGVELCFGICHYVTHKTDLMFVTALPTTFTRLPEERHSPVGLHFCHVLHFHLTLSVRISAGVISHCGEHILKNVSTAAEMSQSPCPNHRGHALTEQLGVTRPGPGT